MTLLRDPTLLHDYTTDETRDDYDIPGQDSISDLNHRLAHPLCLDEMRGTVPVGGWHAVHWQAVTAVFDGSEPFGTWRHVEGYRHADVDWLLDDGDGDGDKPRGITPHGVSMSLHAGQLYLPHVW